MAKDPVAVLVDRSPWRPVSTVSFAVSVAAALLLAYLFTHDSDSYLLGLDDMNLAFHEAGHLIFGILGSTAGLYGGTLGQLVFPVAVAATFHHRREPLGVFAGGVWLAENLLNIARYVGDARAQALPLLGGEHDWTAILGRWGAIEADLAIAGFLRFAAWCGMAGAVYWLFRRWNASESPAPSLPL